MNWIIYVTFLLCKLAIIAGLVLLSILTVPVILFMLCLGMLLAYIRDVEPTEYVAMSKTSLLILENIKSFYFVLISQIISHIPRVPSIRN